MHLLKKQIAGVCFLLTLQLSQISLAQDKIRLRNLTERCVLSLYNVETKSWLQPLVLEKSAEVEIVLTSKLNHHARITFANGDHRDVMLNFQHAVSERKLPANETPNFVLETVDSLHVVPITTSYYKKLPTPIVRNGVTALEEQLTLHTESRFETERVKFCYVSLVVQQNLWVLESPQPILLGLPKMEHDAGKLLQQAEARK